MFVNGLIALLLLAVMALAIGIPWGTSVYAIYWIYRNSQNPGYARPEPDWFVVVFCVVVFLIELAMFLDWLTGTTAKWIM